MANTLFIEKYGSNNFWHTHNGNPLTKYAISDFEISLDGDKFNIVEIDGAKRYSYLIEDITLQDHTVGGGIETFTDPQVFYIRLQDVFYTPFLFTAGGTTKSTVILKKGMGVVLNKPQSWINANFDNTGLGINEMVGWAKKNGNHGTENIGDRVSVAQGTKHPGLTDTGGSEDSIVVAHSHLSGSYNTGGGSVLFTSKGLNSGNDTVYQSTQTTGVSGIGKNMQPYLVELHIERTEDLIFTGGAGGSELNKIISQTGFSLVGQTFTLNALWVWMIAGIQKTNISIITDTIPFCTTGYSRIDLGVLNAANSYQRIQGVESLTTPVAPALPINTIQCTLFFVTDNSASPPSIPIIGDAFVKKLESQDFIANYGVTTVIDQINLIDERSSISLVGSATDIKSVQLSGEFIRPGKPHFFKNRTGHNVKLWHLAGTGNIKYFFPNGLDLIVKPNEVIEFSINANDSGNIRAEFVGPDIALGFTPENIANKNISNGYAGLGSNGKIDPLQLPALAITDTFVVSSQAQMLSLTVDVGDVAVRTDINKSFILRIDGASTLANWQELLSPTSVDQSIIDGSTNAVSGNAVFDGLETKLDKKYSSIKTVGVGGDYATLELLFANEPGGKTLIKLLDTQYTCVNPKFVVKNGWVIQGLGYGKTNITFSFTTPIDVNLSGLQVRVDCELLDLKVTSVNNTNVGGYSQYSLHSDYNTPFKAQITRCWFKTISNPNVADANGYNGLSVGVGTWEGQELEFRECILQGQSVAIDNKYTLNLHNTYITGNHLLPCRVSFYNCQLTGGFTTVLISDNYSNDSELNSNRIKDLFEFVGCEIKGGLYLRSHSQSGTIDKKNGINFNFSGTNVDEFINTSDLVDTSLSNYDINSLPVTKDIEFFKNIGSTAILAGDFVAYVYANRKSEYHLTGLINTIIGVEKLTSANSFNFAGISLTDSGINNFIHLAKGSISYTRLGYYGLNIGDRVSFDSTTGDLVKTFFGGIGKVVKKTDTNRLGIELSPIGKIYNTFGTYTERGVLEILGNAGGAGHPTIWLKDKNVLGQLSNYAISVGSNTNISPYYEQARFSINDNISQTERFSIDIQGITGINRKLKIFNQAVVGDSGAYNLLPVLDVSGFSVFGSASNRFVLGRSSLGSGESGAYFEYGSNIANTTSIQSVSAGVSYRDLALNPQGGSVIVGSLIGTGTRTVVADASGKLSTDILPISGTYTPTLTNTLNVSSSVVHNFYYTRIGDIVTCTFTFTASVTTGSTITGITATLPINRSVTTSYYVGGGVVGPNNNANMSSGKVLLLNNTTRFIFYCIPASTGVNYFTGTFQYSIN